MKHVPENCVPGWCSECFARVEDRALRQMAMPLVPGDQVEQEVEARGSAAAVQKEKGVSP